MASFKAKTKDLYTALKHLKAVVPSKGKRAVLTACIITLTDGIVIFDVPGANFNLKCTTLGECKASVSFLRFLNLIKYIKVADTEIVINTESLQINDLVISATTTFLDKYKIIKPVQLSANYSERDLLNLVKDGYTWEDLEFNNLNPMIHKAQLNLYDNIEKAFRQLQLYGVSYDELEELVLSKLNTNQNKLK